MTFDSVTLVRKLVRYQSNLRWGHVAIVGNSRKSMNSFRGEFRVNIVFGLKHEKDNYVFFMTRGRKVGSENSELSFFALY